MNLSTAHQLSKTEYKELATDLVIDVGLYTGEDTAYYLHRGYRVVAIDANPLMIERAKERFAADILTKRLVLLNVGIFTSSGQFDFWISSHDDWSSFEKANASKLKAQAYAISIPCVRFAEILKQYGVPFYLKIDIEKLDGACLEALTPECRPEYVSWEASIGSLAELEKMRSLGYKVFKCIDQMTLKAASLKDVSTNRRFQVLRRTFTKLESRRLGDWKFKRGLSSGPFGEETDGRWRSFEEIAYDFAAFCEKNPDDEHWPTWLDFHASFKTA
jgi:FkbM family methyltransferase